MKKRLSVPQILFGLVFGLLFVLAAIGGVGYLYFRQLSATPPKPDYPEITEATRNEARSLASVSNETAGGADQSYVALVLVEGLIMREEPESSADVVQTLRLDETVRVYGRSEDGRWEDALLETTGDRGWVQIGNTKRVN